MKMKAGFSLDEITVKRIQALAEGTRRDKSTIVDMAVELLSMQDEFQHLTVVPRTSKPSARKFSPDSIAGVKRGAKDDQYGK
jgi:hypothetical protein